MAYRYKGKTGKDTEAALESIINSAEFIQTSRNMPMKGTGHKLTLQQDTGESHEGFLEKRNRE